MISILASVLAVWQLRRLYAGRATASVGRMWHDAVIALVAGAIAILAWPGGLVMRKVLSELAMPCGILWMLLAGLAVAACRVKHRRLAAGVALTWLLFSAAGNAWVVVALFGWLERGYTQVDPARGETFDAVIVLGGATNTAPDGGPQLTAAGDRVRLGAALFLNGRTPLLVCTGRRIEGASNNPRDAADETADLWQQLGIPDANIIRLPGRTTAEEMAAIRQLLDQRSWQHVGLVTSAWHMRRAQRLARGEGLQLEPLPADFVAGDYSWTGLSFIPDGAAMLRTHFACKELLAGLLRQ